MKLPSLHYQCWVDYRWPVYQSWQSLKCEKNYLVSDQFEFDHSLGYFGFVGVKDSPWGSGYFGAAMVLLSHENQGLWLMIGRKGWWLPSLKQGSWECVINYKGIQRLNWLILVWWPQDSISAFCQWCGFLASLDRNLQHALGRFAAEGEVVGMRVNTSSSEFMVLCQIMVDCSLLVGTEFLPPSEGVQVPWSPFHEWW